MTDNTAASGYEHEHERAHGYEHEQVHEHEHEHVHEHPAIERLHTEFAAARRGLTQIGTMGDTHRERVLAAIRTELPDVASRSAYEAGGDAVLAEIRRFERLDPAERASADEPETDVRPTAVLWGAILADATEAVRATR